MRALLTSCPTFKLGHCRFASYFVFSEKLQAYDAFALTGADGFELADAGAFESAGTGFLVEGGETFYRKRGFDFIFQPAGPGYIDLALPGGVNPPADERLVDGVFRAWAGKPLLDGIAYAD